MIIESDCYDFATLVAKTMFEKYVAPYYFKKGYNVMQLYCNAATREYVLRYLPQATAFLGCGHGSYTVYTGWRGEYVFWSCDSKELSGKLVYLLSCLTGIALGPDIVSKRARAYAGYTALFGWIHPSRNPDPFEDEIAQWFFRPVRGFMEALADGKTIGEAHQRSIELWNESIDYWLKADHPRKWYILEWLYNDRNAQVVLGNSNARIADMKSLEAESAATISVRATLTRPPSVTLVRLSPIVLQMLPLAVLGAVLSVVQYAVPEEREKRGE